VSAIAVLSHGRWRASSSSSSGLGIQPPTPAWGNMRGEGRVCMLNSWRIAAFPELTIVDTALVIKLMGNALRLARSAHDVVKRPDHAVEASDRMPERHGPLGLRR
jgi:ABC-type antimicrobial peptide transport system permease subunit